MIFGAFLAGQGPETVVARIKWVPDGVGFRHLKYRNQSFLRHVVHVDHHAVTGVGPVMQGGEFNFPNLSPGTYRLLAFRRPQPELEYRDPEAMRAYESKGLVVRLVAGQKEHVRLPLVSPGE